MSTTLTATEPMQYLTFHLGGEEYAIGILQVREILQFEEVTRVPSAPAPVRGVLNLRGSVVPVVDLGIKFGTGETEVTRRTCIVIVEVHAGTETVVMGVLADAVSQVVELTPDEIEAPPSFGTRVRSDFLHGMARTGQRFSLVLDIDRLLSPAELHRLAGSDDADAPADDDETAPVADAVA